MAAKGWNYSRHPPRKSSSSATVVFALLVTCSFFIIILLSLKVISIPSGSRGSHHKARDLSSLVHKTVDRSDVDGRGDQWIEVISWEPRAFVYHNFLVRFQKFFLLTSSISLCLFLQNAMGTHESEPVHAWVPSRAFR